MKRRFSEEQIITILKEDVSEAKRLKALEEENRKLKRLVADQALDIVCLKDITSKSGKPSDEEKDCF